MHRVNIIFFIGLHILKVRKVERNKKTHSLKETEIFKKKKHITQMHLHINQSEVTKINVNL